MGLSDEKRGSHNSDCNRILTFNNKKAQITAFIIIGLMLLVAVGLIYYYQAKEAEKAIKIQDFEYSNDPVVAYVQTCLYELGEEAITLIGQQGGYITIEGFDTLTAEYRPFNSNLLSYSNGKINIPYWYYQLEDGIDKLEIPELEKDYSGDLSIQDQIESYVTSNMFECLGDLSTFNDQGINVAIAGETSTEITFTNSNTMIELQLPLDITYTDKTELIDEFEVTIPVALKKTHQLAKEIAEYEYDTQFLEYNTRNLITMYSDISSEYLPPVSSGLAFTDCGEFTYWLYNDVEDDFKSMLTSNIPFLQVDNTDYIRYTISDEDEPNDNDRELRQGVFDHMIQTVSSNKYKSISANFNYYSDFPLELDLGSKGLIQPNVFEIDAYVMKLCMFDYSFSYDIKYPVLISLTDESSSVNNQEFVFQFPLMTVLKDNYPRVRLSDVLSNLSYPDEDDEVPSYLCSPEQRLSGDINVVVKDENNQPIDDVIITFQCGPDYVYEYDENGTITSVNKFSDICFIGKTETGVMTEQFPPCNGGGMVNLKHADYLSTSELTGTIEQDSSLTLTYTLPTVYTKNIEVRKFYVKPPAEQEENITDPGVVLDEDYNVTECNLRIEDKPLQPYEQALVTLTKTDTENGNLNSAPVTLYSLDETNTIDIAQGTYNVEINLMREERYPGEMTIKANSQSMVVPNGTFSSETFYYPEDDVLIEQAFTGGASYSLQISKEDLENSDTIIFYVFDEGPANRIEEVGQPLEHIETCSELNYDMIEPEFS